LTQRDSILERLKSGEPWSEVSRGVKSRSTLYDAATLFFSWADRRVENLQSSISELEGEHADKRAEVKKLNSEIRRLGREKDALENSVGELTRESESLSAEVESGRVKLSDLTSEYEQLQGKGVKEENLARIGRIDFGSDDELLERILTCESYIKLRDEQEVLWESNKELKSQLDSAMDRLGNLKTSISSEENKLDEKRRRNLIFDEANLVIQGFIEEGYNIDILLSLLSSLKDLAIEGEVRTSIMRLIHGLKNAGTLSELEASVIREEAKLEKLRSETSKVSGELSALRDYIEVDITNLSQRVLKIYEDLLSEGILECGRNLQSINVTLSRLYGLEAYSMSKDERTLDPDKEVSDGLSIIGFASLFNDILNKPSKLEKRHFEFIVGVMDALYYWCTEYAADEKVRPDEITIMMESKLDEKAEYYVLPLIGMVLSYFQERSKKPTQKFIY